jgi:hypothetical protein
MQNKYQIKRTKAGKKQPWRTQAGLAVEPKSLTHPRNSVYKEEEEQHQENGIHRRSRKQKRKTQSLDISNEPATRHKSCGMLPT